MDVVVVQVDICPVSSPNHSSLSGNLIRHLFLVRPVGGGGMDFNHCETMALLDRLRRSTVVMAVDLDILTSKSIIIIL